MFTLKFNLTKFVIYIKMLHHKISYIYKFGNTIFNGRSCNDEDTSSQA